MNVTELEKFVSEKMDKVGQSLNMDLSEKKRVVESCKSILSSSDRSNDNQGAITALKSFKILSREKKDVNEIVDEDLMNLILKESLITDEDKNVSAITDQELEVVDEAQRCLNNFLLQSTHAQVICSKNQTLPGILRLITTWKPDNDIAVKILTFDLKILFLVTALCQETRKMVFLDHRGLPRLINFLNLVISDAKENESERSPHPVLSKAQSELICEALKCLFNITLHLEDQSPDEEEDSQLNELSDCLQSLLTIEVEDETSKLALHSNCVNLLSTVPVKNTDPLMKPLKKDLVPENAKELEYDGFCMNCIRVILDFLLVKTEDEAKLREGTTPALSVLCKLSRGHRAVRKYLRSEILPPLRDLTNRPEVGDKARNKLCKLLTSPVDSVSSMVAEFLFILCKESVSRMVKYTGYGNAAGLLARRGLMLGGKGSNAGIYSDEEDSDTEEYAEAAHKVNPIVGCVEPVKPSPFEGMSDEQKEFEAMKLVNLINDLQNIGVVKPAVPGADGRPQEMDHVLQMREAVQRMQNPLDQQQQGEENSDSD